MLDVAHDNIQVSTSAAPKCGQAGAQAVAAKRAAIETPKRSFDIYVLNDGIAKNNVRVVGNTPVHANTQTKSIVNGYGDYATYNAQSNTMFSGGQPIIGGGHEQALLDRMFHQGDAGSDSAIDARLVLGPDWQKLVKSSAMGNSKIQLWGRLWGS